MPFVITIWSLPSFFSIFFSQVYNNFATYWFLFPGSHLFFYDLVLVATFKSTTFMLAMIVLTSATIFPSKVDLHIFLITFYALLQILDNLSSYVHSNHIYDMHMILSFELYNLRGRLCCCYNWFFFLHFAHVYIMIISTIFYAMFASFSYFHMWFWCCYSFVDHFGSLQVSFLLHITKLPPYAIVMWSI